MALEVVAASRRAALPLTVRGPDGLDIRIPRWMTEPAAGHMVLASTATLAITALRAVAELLAVHHLWTPSASATDPPSQTATANQEGPHEADAL
jgi:hypothetical protein